MFKLILFLFTINYSAELFAVDFSYVLTEDKDQCINFADYEGKDNVLVIKNTDQNFFQTKLNLSPLFAGHFCRRQKPFYTGDYIGFGDVFVAARTPPKAKNSVILSLRKLNEGSLFLSKNRWARVMGARKLFHPLSIIKDSYLNFIETKEYKIELLWSSRQSIEKYADTKIAINLTSIGVEVKAFSGAILEYTIHTFENVIAIEVHDAYDDYVIHSLELGRVRGHGEGLLLEVKDLYDAGPSFQTKFVLSLYGQNENGESVDLGNFKISGRELRYSEEKKCYELHLGLLDYPAEYKEKGQKIKVYLSTFRQFQTQIRSRVLKGRFKI